MSTNYNLTLNTTDPTITAWMAPTEVHLAKTFGTADGLGIIVQGYRDSVVNDNGTRLFGQVHSGQDMIDNLSDFVNRPFAVTSDNGVAYTVQEFIALVEGWMPYRINGRHHFDAVAAERAAGKFMPMAEDDVVLDANDWTIAYGEWE